MSKIEKYPNQPEYKTADEIYAALVGARIVEAAIREMYDRAEEGGQTELSVKFAGILGHALEAEAALQALHDTAEAAEE